MEAFKTIVADPPWAERGAGKIKRGADRHYPLMDTDAIRVLMGSKLMTTPLLARAGTFLVAENAHLYLWVTNNFLEDGLRVMRELGFRYVTNVVWVKTQMGIGQYFRGAHELCLFGVRGSGFDVRTERRDLSTKIEADFLRDAQGRRVHSGKPEAFYRLAEARSHGPRLEMFARRPRAGWTVWGNEVQP